MQPGQRRNPRRPQHHRIAMHRIRIRRRIAEHHRLGHHIIADPYQPGPRMHDHIAQHERRRRIAHIMIGPPVILRMDRANRPPLQKSSPNPQRPQLNPRRPQRLHMMHPGRRRPSIPLGRNRHQPPNSHRTSLSQRQGEASAPRPRRGQSAPDPVCILDDSISSSHAACSVQRQPRAQRPEQPARWLSPAHGAASRSNRRQKPTRITRNLREARQIRPSTERV